MGSNEKSKEAKKFQKSYFDVLGLCCTSEIPLIERILKPLDGIEEVSVIVPSRTVIVVHDNLLISQIQIVKALNSARLEANIQVYGEEKYGKKWPSPYTMACGILLLLSFFKFLFHPLHWLAVGAVAVGLPPIILRSIAATRNFMLDVNILVLIAVGGAIALRDYWEAGSIVFLFTIAEWLESRASHKATAVMSSLMNMAPQKAVLAETGQVIDAKDVNMNTILAVKAGEVIPIDGIVVEGKCEVDEKTLTGESFPVAKQNQSIVWAGTINLNGYISVKTTALAEDCVVAKMAKLVEEAQNKKSKTQRFIDKCAKYYTPAVVLISAGLAAVPAALRVHDLKHWLHLALVILVSACPCALILSTPVATFCALTKAATTGLLIKGGDYLEILAKIKIMAFDKTGTITRGEFSVTDFRSLCHDVSLNTLLYWVSSIESKSSHPMATALVDYGLFNTIEPKPENVKEFQNFPGEGIYGEIDGEKIYVGNRKIAMRAGCETVPTVGGDTMKGATIGYIFSGTTLVGIFSLEDACRSGVAEAINELKLMGIKTTMLTGDSHVAAMRVQNQLANAIEVIHAELLPEEKVRIIEELKKEGPTAMVGDGVNDAPALANADIGMSMGVSGSALATETGHIILMSNDIRKIPQAIRLAKKTHWKIVENVGLSIVTKAAILALAFSGHPLLWAAVLADVGTCLVVIFNSMLLLRGTDGHGRRCHKSSCTPHVNGHSSHGGCAHAHHPHSDHDIDACGSNHLHNLSSQHQCSSHGDHTSNSCEQKKDHTIASRYPCGPVKSGSCEKDSCMNTISMHDAHDDHNCCTASTHDMASHVIHINKVANGVHRCENHSSHHRHTACAEDDSLSESVNPNCSESGQHDAKNASHDHSNSITCATNHHDKGLESSNGHVHHSHEEELSKTNCSTGCLHDGDRHVECMSREMMGSTMGKEHEESTAMDACKCLKNREIGGCCRSFRKECGRTHGCHGGGIEGLSEIVTE